jgi:lipopolysaccharide transport system permease protein
MLASAWRYRRFIASSIRADFQARFARSRVGLLWIIAQPLAQVAIFSFVLSGLLATRIPNVSGPYAYVIYLMAGTLCWSLFSDVVSRCLAIFIDSGNLIKKIAFPRVSLPLIVTGIAFVNNAALFIVVACAAALLGYPLSIHYVWLPVLVLLTVALATGLGIICGTLNVFSRDVGQVVPVLLQLLFWMTPIVYMPSILPEAFQQWIAWNPLAAIVESYQDVILFARSPAWDRLLPAAVLSAVLLAVALGLFRRAASEMPDVL